MHVSEEELFIGKGIYLARYSADSDAYVIIAPPLFEEHPRTRKTLINIARDMSQAGFNAVRFDYYGTGLSHGDSRDISVSSAVGGLKDALGYCYKKGAKKIICLGFRFGGYIAMELRKSTDVKLILWEPVLDLKKYFNGLINIAIGNQLIMYGAVLTDKNRLVADLKTNGNIFIDGYDISIELYSQFMSSADYASRLPDTLRSGTSVILWRDKKLHEELKALGIDTAYLPSTKLAWDSIRYIAARPEELFRATMKRLL